MRAAVTRASGVNMEQGDTPLVATLKGFHGSKSIRSISNQNPTFIVPRKSLSVLMLRNGQEIQSTRYRSFFIEFNPNGTTVQY